MNSIIDLAENVRTIVSDNLLRNISLVRMQRKLIELYVDWNNNNDSDSVFGDADVLENLRYYHCQCLNDERVIKFNQGWKQADYVFDEKRQIWIDKYIDTEKDDLFIPRDDIQ